MTDTDTQTTNAVEVARGYFGAFAAGDIQAQRTWYHPDAVLTLQGTFTDFGKDDAVAWFDGLRAAFPDLQMEILDILEGDEVAAVHWRITGTFTGTGTFQGFAPNGARLDTQGCDIVRAHEGKVISIKAYTDGMTIARQIGAMPPADSGAERAMAKAFNVKTAIGSRANVAKPVEIADGVWRINGGFPRKFANAYAIRDSSGVLLFDTGIKPMVKELRRHTQALGGLTRVVLGHGHFDHRGAAGGLGVPIYCHPDEVAIAESESGGMELLDPSIFLPPTQKMLPMLAKLWDGGPVKIAGTVSEGEDIAGFRVVAVPGHSPGMIALWRESDRLALTSDTFYRLNIDTFLPSAVRRPPAGSGPGSDGRIRDSILKIAALNPAMACPGHGNPATGDVKAQLEGLAATIQG